MLDELFEGRIELPDNRGDYPETLKKLPSGRGLLLFTDAESNPIQLLISASLRRLAVSRLTSAQPEDDKLTKKLQLDQVTRHIYFSVYHNQFRTHLNNLRLVKKLWPKSYTDYITLPRQSFIKIDPTADWPNFKITQSPAFAPSITFGTFPSRSSTAQFTQCLVDTFELCREPALVDDPQKASACPYLQMDQCPAPCVGNISKERYLFSIDLAIKAASGQGQEVKEILSKQMQDHAAKMEFENAQAIKDRLKTLETLFKPSYDWTSNLVDTAILHIDLSAKVKGDKRKKVQSYASFLIFADRVVEYPDFILDDIDKIHEKWLSDIDNHKFSGAVNKELLALTSWFLYKNNRPGIWLSCRKQLPRKDFIASIIQPQKSKGD